MTTECREIHVALPDTGGDIYLQHQKVWEVMASHIDRRRRESFIYAMRSPRMAHVRSAYLLRGHPAAMPASPLCMTLVTAKQVDGRLVALRGQAAFDKVRALLTEHGIYPEQLAIDEQFELIGFKAKQQRRIALPVSHIRFVPRISNPAKAHLAWCDGIGRGKRFGCGMLRVA